jgi:hypothetical protein
MSSSLFGQMALTAALIACLAQAANAETTPRMIIDSWRARESKIKSARIEWVQRRLDKKGTVKGGVFPAEDTEFETKFLVELDGSNTRMESHGFMWHFDNVNSYNDTSGHLLPETIIGVYSNGIFKHLNESSGRSLQYGRIVKTPIEDEEAQSNVRCASCWPATWYIRPFLFPERVLMHGHHSELTILSESADGGIVGGRAGTADRMTIDPTQDHLITHATADGIELQIEYARHDTYGPIPHRWTIVETSHAGDIVRVGSHEITRFELNTPIPADRFELAFPVGTRVTDEHGNNMEVNAAGQLVPRVLISRPTDYSQFVWLIVTVTILAALCLVYAKRRKVTA